MIWRRKTPKEQKILTEKEVQEKLYGARLHPKVDDGLTAKKESVERLENLEKERQEESLKRRVAEEELGKLRQELDGTKGALKKLSGVLAAKESGPSLWQRFSLRLESLKTRVKVSPRAAALFLVLLVVVPLLVRLIYVGTSSPQPEQVSPKEGSRVSLPTPYTIQICVYEKKDDAEVIVGSLKQKDYPAWLSTRTSPKGKLYYNIYLGRFATDEEASRFLAAVKTREEFKEFEDSFVRRF